MNLSGYKPDKIKVQHRGQKLTVTAKQRSEENGFQCSRDFHRRILLPDDVDLTSVTTRLSKEGLLTIEAPRVPASFPSQKTLNVTTKELESQTEDENAELTSDEEEGKEQQY